MNALGEATSLPVPPHSASRVGAVLAVMGAWMQAGPFIGILGTVLGMHSAFQNMGKSGLGDPAGLAKPIGEVLISTMIGVVTGIVGLVLMLLGLVVFRCRQRWLVWVLALTGIFWLIVVPGGLFFMKLFDHGSSVVPHP